MFTELIAAGHNYHDLMWVYPIALVHHFYSLAIRRQHRELGKLGSVLQLTGYSARSLDEKGHKALTKTWKGFFDNIEKVMRSAERTAASQNAVIDKNNAKKIEAAKKETKFLKPKKEAELNPVITTTGNAAADAFLKVAMPTKM